MTNNKSVIKSKTIIRDAIKILDKSDIKNLIVEENKKIIGLFTEGDFRTAVLKGIDINNEIKNIVNKNFKYLKKNYTRKQILQILKKNPRVHVIPVLNHNRSLIKIITREEFSNNIKKKYKNIDVVIMAGGQGKRLDPFTRILPKPLVPIGESTLLEKIVEKFSQSGLKSFFISLNDKKNIIKSYIKENLKNTNLKIIEEKNQLGTIGALKLFEKKISNFFFVTNCDVLIDANFKDIIDQHVQNKCDLTIVSTFKNFSIPYGVFKVSKNGNLINFKEKPSVNQLVNCGLYLMNKKIIKFIPNKKKFDADQLIKVLLKNKKKIKIFPISEFAWQDFGVWNEYFKNS